MAEKDQVSDGPTLFVRALYTCETCQAHRLPIRTSSAPYNAEEFKNSPSVPVRLTVNTWSYEKAAIELHATSGELFAVCPLDGQKSSDSVERAVGSSRYFALKVKK